LYSMKVTIHYSKVIKRLLECKEKMDNRICWFSVCEIKLNIL
jgi:hypothetical protein